MPDSYQQQFNEDRAQQAQASAQDRARQDQSVGQDKKRQTPATPPEPVSFPWGMLTLAIFFDLIGLVPFLNFLTESLAGLIFGLWQKFYNPKLDPILTFVVAKIIDALSLGILPSNIGIVVYSYMKKKSLSVKEKLAPLANSRLGKLAIKNIDSYYS